MIVTKNEHPIPLIDSAMFALFFNPADPLDYLSWNYMGINIIKNVNVKTC
jgi:hypothetical protein